MKLKETDTKKLASLAISHENGYLLQKECLVDIQNGQITVGNSKLEGSHYDEKSKIMSMVVNYRGTEFDLDTEGDLKKIKNVGLFIMKSVKEETIQEKKLKNINPTNAAWKNRV